MLQYQLSIFLLSAYFFAFSFILFNNYITKATFLLYYSKAFDNKNFKNPKNIRLCIFNSNLNQEINYSKFIVLNKILSFLDKFIIFNRY